MKQHHHNWQLRNTKPLCCRLLVFAPLSPCSLRRAPLWVSRAQPGRSQSLRARWKSATSKRRCASSSRPDLPMPMAATSARTTTRLTDLQQQRQEHPPRFTSLVSGQRNHFLVLIDSCGHLFDDARTCFRCCHCKGCSNCCVKQWMVMEGPSLLLLQVCFFCALFVFSCADLGGLMLSV